MKPKRYVLLEAEGEATPEEWKALAGHLEERFGKMKLISLEENRRFFILKTDNAVAPQIRGETEMNAGGKSVKTVLTSGSIGKLKRRAAESQATGFGEVPQ